MFSIFMYYKHWITVLFGLILLFNLGFSLISNDSSKKISLSTDFNCNSGKFIINTTESVGVVQVELTEISPVYRFIGRRSINSDGAEFTIIESGTYMINLTEYGDTANIELTFCNHKKPQNIDECTLDSDCLNTKACVSGKCVDVIGACGYISNHSWVNYECCTDTNCTSNYECISHICKAIQNKTETNNSVQLNYTVSTDNLSLTTDLNETLNEKTSDPSLNSQSQAANSQGMVGAILFFVLILGVFMVLLVMVVFAYFMIKEKYGKKNKGVK